MSALDNLLKEMESKGISGKDKPMPEIKVGDMMYVENVSQKNLAVVVADTGSDLMVHFTGRLNSICIPVSKILEDIIVLIKFKPDQNRMDVVWMKNGQEELQKLFAEAVQALFDGVTRKMTHRDTGDLEEFFKNHFR